MPMDFPDMNSLIMAAEVHKFRKPKKDEPEIEYRTALADHVAPRDFIESEEIRNGIGWNRFNDGQNKAMLGRGIIGKKQQKITSKPKNPKQPDFLWEF